MKQLNLTTARINPRLFLRAGLMAAFLAGAGTSPASGPVTGSLKVTPISPAVLELTPTPTPSPTPTLGHYPNTSVPLSGDTTVTPDATPANATSIIVSTDTNFKGTFAASPTTGVVTVTDAHPAGTYTVTVTAFGPGGTTTKTFTLTVTSSPCGANFTDGFSDAADVGTGNIPTSVAIGDFNGDGKQDLAVVHQSSGTVSIRLGDGLGDFGGSTEVGVGSSPYSVAIGDFNGDGKQDLAVANANSNTVSIRLGNGLGGFSGSTNVSVGMEPISVAIGDFNGDGKQDLAVVNQLSDTVSIRLGDGLGGFSGSTNVSVGFLPHAAAIGDFNGDGKQDLAVANNGENTVSIRLGDGLGGFSSSTNVSVGSGPVSVAIGDFNGDGKQDLAVANYSSDTVSIRVGDGLGGFSGSTNVSVGIEPISVAIGDFNRDGKQDLAVANNTLGTVSIRLGDGLGGFGGSTNINVGSNPGPIAIGDFNGDGTQDLAVANFSSSLVSIRLGECIPVPTPTPTPTPAPTDVNISGIISYCPDSSPVPNVTLTLTGTSSGSTLSDGSGNYALTGVIGGSYTVTPSKATRTPGSSGIDTVDALAAQMDYLRIAQIPVGCRRDAADVDGDTLINTVDVTAIQRFFLGKTFGLANAGKYKFTPASRAYVGIVTDQINQNYDTLIFGDIVGPFAERPDSLSQIAAGVGTSVSTLSGLNASADEVAATVAGVALPEIAIDPSKSNFIAQVTSTAIDAKNKLVGFQGDFTFDERAITFQSEPVQKAGLTGGNWNVSGSVLPGPGPVRTLRISAYSKDFTPLSGSGTLFELRIARVGKEAQRTQLTWATASDQFIFIDADLKTQKPGNAAPGSVVLSRKRK